MMQVLPLFGLAEVGLFTSGDTEYPNIWFLLIPKIDLEQLISHLWTVWLKIHKCKMCDNIED